MDDDADDGDYDDDGYAGAVCSVFHLIVTVILGGRFYYLLLQAFRYHL